MRAEIAEIFWSIQGEGIFYGAKQIFIRFASCNLRPRCLYCDTGPFPNVEVLESSEVRERVGDLLRLYGPVHSISLTGGEPLLCADYLKGLIPLLKDLNLVIYLETNGTLPQELRKVINLVDIIAMDMKLPSSTGLSPFWEEHREFLQVGKKRRIFVKTVLTRKTDGQDLEKVLRIIEGVDRGLPLVLQPVTAMKGIGPPDIKTLLELRERIGKRLESVRIIPQIHKIMGVR